MAILALKVCKCLNLRARFARRILEIHMKFALYHAVIQLAAFVCRTAVAAFKERVRASGIRTQLYGEQKKFKHKIGYADKLGIPFVIFLGEDEINAGVVAVKDMESGEQVKVSLDEAVNLIRAGLAKKNEGRVICDK